jgi:hypothetical protein
MGLSLRPQPLAAEVLVTTTGPLKFYTVAEAVRVAVDSALTYPVQRSGVVPGTIAWDECDCGLLAVSTGRAYLSDNFPEEETSRIGQCEAAWEVIEIVVQIIRCAPGPQGETQLAPTVAALDAAAQIMMTDLQQALAAIALWICASKDSGLIVDGMIMPSDPQGPEGDCVGSELHAVVALPRG